MSDSDVVIRVEGLGKRYSLHHAEGQRRDNFREMVTQQLRLGVRLLNPFTLAGQLRKAQREASHKSADYEEEFWALKDVSFEIRRGERVGIIGRNGAGKSTLLKILSRITEPTTGRVEIRGRVASLLEVGTGFHPELTGRENIYLNGAILGMTRREIRAKFDEIVDFAEVEKFLDTPVKRYSSGMYVRLAFAVAAHLEPEILVVDEVLAVGDSRFQKKCLGKMEAVAEQDGRSILFVSHNMPAVKSLTSRSIYLLGGRVQIDDSSEQVVNQYMLNGINPVQYAIAGLDTFRRDKASGKEVRIGSISVNSLLRKVPELTTGDTIKIELVIESIVEVDNANISISIKNSLGDKIALVFSWDHDFRASLVKGDNYFMAKISNLGLAPGLYFADIGLNKMTDTAAYDVIIDYPLIKINYPTSLLYWEDRPWGLIHHQSVTWQQRCPSTINPA